MQMPGTEYYLGLKIAGEGYEYFSDYSQAIYEHYYKQIGITRTISGTCEALTGHNRSSGVSRYRATRLFNEIGNVLIEDELDTVRNELHSNLYSNSTEYDFTDEESGVHYSVLIARLDGTDINAITIFEIQELGRPFKFVSRYYYYIFALQILLIIVLSLIYSRWFTKPLLQLNRSAGAIANEDFSISTSIHTGDELEELSDNINMISKNLSESIAKLEDKNKQLDEYALTKASDEERMRDLLMDMSHEFKTPLGIISGFIEVLNDGVGSKPAEYYLNAISDEVDGLDELVRNTLELTRLESGNYGLNKRDFDISDLIKNTADKFRAQIIDRSMSLIVETTELNVNADYEKMKRVMINLLSNAIQYSSNGAEITVMAEAERDRCKVSVTNSGVDVPRGDAARMFERYYRSEKSRNRGMGGHGLGLSIVKNVLELHGYEYGVIADEGNLTVFFYSDK